MALPLDKTSKTYVVVCVDWLEQYYPTNNHNGLALRSGGGTLYHTTLQPPIKMIR
jgi:hypothetical protein